MKPIITLWWVLSAEHMSIKKNISSYINYAFASLSSSIVNIILVPIYTAHISVEEYGILELIFTVSFLLNFIFTFGFKSSILNCFHRDYDSDDDRRKLISSGVTFVGAVTIVIAVLLIYFSKPFSKLLLSNEQYSPLIILMLIWNAGQNLIVIFLTIFRSLDNVRIYLSVSLLQASLIMVFNLLFLLKYKMGLYGILLGNSLAITSAVILCIIYLRKELKLSISFPHLLNLLKYGLPIIPASISAWILGLSDRILLSKLSSLAEVGLYSLGNKFALIVYAIAVTPFLTLWPTLMYKIARDDDADKKFTRIFSLYCAVSMFFFILISVLAKEIVILFFKSVYIQAYTVVFLLTIGYFLNGAHYIVISGMHLGKKIILYPLVSIGAALLNILINFVLIPKFGMIGAAVSSVISYVILFYFTYLISQRVYHIKYNVIKILHVLMVSSIIYLCVYKFEFKENYLTILFKVLIVFAVYPSLLWVSRFFSREEISYFKALLSKYTSKGDVL